MAEGKWIRGLEPETELRDAAHRVLEVRLAVVREYLPRAVKHADEDPENVHQLRVGTRRADAALRIFRPCLPGRVYRAARARLRKIRRAAGAARDWDVFLLALRQRLQNLPPEEQPGIDFLLGHALGHREAAQTELEQIEAGLFEPFAEFVNDVLDEVRTPREPTFVCLGDLARLLVLDRLERLHKAAAADLKDYDHLHAVRIAGKRLRYAMEVLADCFPPAFRDRLYPMVEEMQEILGRANDSHVAAGRLSALRGRLTAWPDVWTSLRPGVEALLRFHQRRLPQERRRFLKWWEQWRQAGVEEVLA